MKIEELRKQNELVNLFCNLAEIPSPSLHEEKVIDWICNYCKNEGLNCEKDDYNNIYITIAATAPSKKPVLLSSHMDVIGDDSPVNVYLDGDLIRAQNRTLGADDKAGIANALYFAAKLNKRTDLKHGGLELHFTRDEESGMTGIKNTDFGRIKSKYVLVLDSDILGQFMTSGASYVTVYLKVKALKGGHSGVDIADPERENAAKLIADLISEMPQGVFYSENGKTVTSCNIGGIISGDINVTNIINTDAQATYSIRSSRKDKENELMELMQETVNAFNAEYKDIAFATIEFVEKMPMFEENPDKKLPRIFEKAAAKTGVQPEVSCFHAGAETHIYANKFNAGGERFSPYLVGLATVCNMHSNKEYLDYTTLLKGQELLEAFFVEYNK